MSEFERFKDGIGRSCLRLSLKNRSTGLSSGQAVGKWVSLMEVFSVSLTGGGPVGNQKGGLSGALPELLEKRPKQFLVIKVIPVLACDYFSDESGNGFCRGEGAFLLIAELVQLLNGFIKFRLRIL
ncbi:hypothetical protein IC235_08755 [Hymenobacter sp. BT664]|uniref:Uncharacterized protein n=1 Tax=Hymenobacter montanus TaxID=2771359 RepID=A0A927GJC8_9BACT|nr:hypothetical protein [Hymenobacter montanus]MBD2767981.1 hypothetical protein [Hymenobacter montanus]